MKNYKVMLFPFLFGITVPTWLRGCLVLVVLYYDSNIAFQLFFFFVCLFLVSRILKFLFILFGILRFQQSTIMNRKKIAPPMKQPQYSSLPHMAFGQICPQHTGTKMKEVLNYYHKDIPRRTTKIQLLQLLVQLEREVNEVEKVDIEDWLKGRFGNEPWANIFRSSVAAESFQVPNIAEQYFDREGWKWPSIEV
jgi:hypothetical protein